MKFAATLALLAGIFFSPNQSAAAQTNAIIAANQPNEYVRLVGLGDGSEIIASIQVRKAIKVPIERAPSLVNGYVRLYIEADVLNLISGEGGLPGSIRYLVDLPLTAKGKAPKIKKQRFIIFANRNAQRANEVQLNGPDAQLTWSPSRENNIRSIARELLAVDSPPALTGIREVFHVPGNLEGEGETQIFLNTENNAPISISVIRRPGIKPSWAISLTEIVDAAATRPSRGTLLWYRLACGLPKTLPRDALYSANSSADNIAREDYALVMRELGPCR